MVVDLKEIRRSQVRRIPGSIGWIDDTRPEKSKIFMQYAVLPRDTIVESAFNKTNLWKSAR